MDLPRQNDLRSRYSRIQDTNWTQRNTLWSGRNCYLISYTIVPLVVVAKTKMPRRPKITLHQAQDISRPLINRLLPRFILNRINNSVLFHPKRLQSSLAIWVQQQKSKPEHPAIPIEQRPISRRIIRSLVHHTNHCYRRNVACILLQQENEWTTTKRRET